MEQEFEGDHIARLARRPDGGAIADALVGCRFYRVDPDATRTIRSYDPAAGLLELDRGRRTAIAGEFVLCNGDQLGTALNAALGEVDRALLRRERVIAAFGIACGVEQDDITPLAAVIDATSRGELPAPRCRAEALRLARKYGSARTVLKLVDSWAGSASTVVPGDILIQRVSALRELGEIDKALAATDRLRHPESGLGPDERSILFTQRAALWLDLFELRGDPLLVARARESADRSWAMAPSPQCSLVYKRLDKIEAAIREERNALSAEAARRRGSLLHP